MAIKKKDEILASLNTILGEDTDDNMLSLIEDVSDTFDDLDKRASSDVDWESKYNELDASWKKRYRERFFNGTPDDDDDIELPDDDAKKPRKFEDLFKVEKR